MKNRAIVLLTLLVTASIYSCGQPTEKPLGIIHKPQPGQAPAHIALTQDSTVLLTYIDYVRKIINPKDSFKSESNKSYFLVTIFYSKNMELHFRHLYYEISKSNPLDFTQTKYLYDSISEDFLHYNQKQYAYKIAQQTDSLLIISNIAKSDGKTGYYIFRKKESLLGWQNEGESIDKVDYDPIIFLNQPSDIENYYKYYLYRCRLNDTNTIGRWKYEWTEGKEAGSYIVFRLFKEKGKYYMQNFQNGETALDINELRQDRRDKNRFHIAPEEKYSYFREGFKIIPGDSTLKIYYMKGLPKTILDNAHNDIPYIPRNKYSYFENFYFDKRFFTEE